MSELRTPDYSDDLDELANRFMLSQILFSALKLGLFESLVAGGKNAETLAADLRSDTRGVRILADALAGIGLLEKLDGCYVLGSHSARCLTDAGSESRTAIYLHAADNYERWSHLSDAVQAGRLKRSPQSSSDPTRTREFALAMADIARRSAPKVLEQLEDLKPRRMLDLGGGPGIYAAAFARKLPALKAVVFDREEAVQVAAQIIVDAGLQDRVSTLAGDFFKDQPGSDYDFIFISNVMHMYGPDSCMELLKRAASWLGPGGVICIKDFILDETRTSPLGAAVFALQMLLATDEGDCYTLGEVSTWLNAAGLVASGTKELTPQSRLVLARKI